MCVRVGAQVCVRGHAGAQVSVRVRVGAQVCVRGNAGAQVSVRVRVGAQVCVRGRAGAQVSVRLRMHILPQTAKDVRSRCSRSHSFCFQNAA